jgi:broad specificity phosphatase PhoE
VVLVTHVGVIQTLRRLLRSEPMTGFGATPVDYSSISTLVRRGDGYELESYNVAP